MIESTKLANIRAFHTGVMMSAWIKDVAAADALNTVINGMAFADCPHPLYRAAVTCEMTADATADELTRSHARFCQVFDELIAL